MSAPARPLINCVGSTNFMATRRLHEPRTSFFHEFMAMHNLMLHLIQPVPGSGEIILIGSRTPLDLEKIKGNFGKDPSVVKDLEKIGIRSGLELTFRLLADDATLRRIYGNNGIIRDQHNQLEQSIYDSEQVSKVRLN